MATFNSVKDLELRNQELFARMDRDKDLLYLVPYVLRDDEGEAVSGVINVTVNLPATFAAHVHATLLGASQQVQVTGKDMDDDRAKEIKDFVEFAIASADMRLRKRGDAPLRPFITEQVDMRGRAAYRSTVRMEKSQFIVDIFPIDTRYFTYEMGVDGMIWGAIKTLRSPAMVKSEYPEFKLTPEMQQPSEGGGVGTLALVEVTDMWEKGTNKIFVNGVLLKTIPHKYGEPPLGVEIVPMGSMLQDADRISHRGESIFFLIRDLVDEINRLVSILQTQNMATVQAAKTYHSVEGAQAEVPKGAGDIGTTTAAEIDGGFKLVPQGDLGNAGQLLQTILSRFYQQGALSSTDFGNLQFPLSAVALVKLGEASGQVFLPRLGAKGLLFQQLVHMIIKQTLALGVATVELGTPGHRRTFKTADLKGEYDIEFLYTPQSPETDVARFAMAVEAAQWLPDEDVLEKVLRVENPAETKRKKLIDNAEIISPNILRLHTAQAFIKEGRELEAEILANEMGVSIEALIEGEGFEAPLVPQPTPINPSATAALADPATKAASNKRASQLSGQPGGQEGRA